mmetsp:Transcript_147091/g.273951  ORF Transcript_147091/g.273951 Transcript_147091/m.273951 type:complete len:227 (+) Transcript_147091:170-850(+)
MGEMMHVPCKRIDSICATICNVHCAITIPDATTRMLQLSADLCNLSATLLHAIDRPVSIGKEHITQGKAYSVGLCRVLCHHTDSVLWAAINLGVLCALDQGAGHSPNVFVCPIHVEVVHCDASRFANLGNLVTIVHDLRRGVSPENLLHRHPHYEVLRLIGEEDIAQAIHRHPTRFGVPGDDHLSSICSECVSVYFQAVRVDLQYIWIGYIQPLSLLIYSNSLRMA